MRLINSWVVTALICFDVVGEKEIVAEGQLPERVAVQYRDNIHWITEAGKNRLVVGSQARILYADQRARVALALAFNRAIRGNENENTTGAAFGTPRLGSIGLGILCKSALLTRKKYSRIRLYHPRDISSSRLYWPFSAGTEFFHDKTSGYIIQPSGYIGHFEMCEKEHLRA